MNASSRQSRRAVMQVLGGAALALPLTAQAQQRATAVIGVLGAAWPEDPEVAVNLAAFQKGLNDTGFVEGRNVAVEYRWARHEQQRLPALAAELVARKVDVIMIEGGTPAALAAKNATSTIPIVFHASDAIADGLVSNLARPGGNLTGVSLFGPEVLAKQFQLCSELLPESKTIGLLVIPRTQSGSYAIREIEEAARARGMQLQVVDVAGDSELDAAYASLGLSRAGLIVRAHVTLADKLVALAARHSVPAVYNQRPFAVAGGLLSYGPSIAAAYVIKGIYTGKILQGVRPAELPVQQVTKLDLVINLKTAKALGLTVPQPVFARADEVID
jgi:putative tryptophan/tyrosine transport system substrate-binding protein